MNPAFSSIASSSASLKPSHSSASNGQPITFAEWGYLGKGKFQRRDFRFDDSHAFVCLQRRGLALRPSRQARDLHADQDLPADDGARAWLRHAWRCLEEAA